MASSRWDVKKITRVIFAGIMLDTALREGRQGNALIAGIATRHKVDLRKIRKSVESQVLAREHIRAQGPPPDARKASIAKLGTLNAPAKRAPAAKKAAPKKASAKEKGKGKGKK